MTAGSAGSPRRSSPLSLLPGAREEGDEPDRWGPPVGDPARRPCGAVPRARVSVGKAYSQEYVPSRGTR